MGMVNVKSGSELGAGGFDFSVRAEPSKPSVARASARRFFHAGTLSDAVDFSFIGHCRNIGV